MAHRYEKLTVWQKSMDLVEEIYLITKKFPSDEKFGLTTQMRRCAVSIPSNIAEGSQRNTNKEFYHFLTIAFGSGAELETQLRIAKRLQFMSESDYEKASSLSTEVMKMLNTFKSKIRRLVI